jgi:hypothetical protein
MLSRGGGQAGPGRRAMPSMNRSRIASAVPSASATPQRGAVGRFGSAAGILRKIVPGSTRVSPPRRFAEGGVDAFPCTVKSKRPQLTFSAR